MITRKEKIKYYFDDHRSGQISYSELFEKIYEIVTFEEKKEYFFVFKQYLSQNILKISTIDYIEGFIPNNLLHKLNKETVNIPPRQKKVFEDRFIKKEHEWHQLLRSYLYDENQKVISFLEAYRRYEAIFFEDKSGWDFYDSKSKMNIEITVVYKAGKATNDIVKEFDVSKRDAKNLLYKHSEVFEEAQRVLIKKFKKTSLEPLNRIIAVIDAYDDTAKRIARFDSDTAESEFRRITKYHELIVSYFSKNNAAFEKGEIVFVFGMMNLNIWVYKVENFSLHLDPIKLKNWHSILSSSLSFNEIDEKELEIFKKRIFKVDN